MSPNRATSAALVLVGDELLEGHRDDSHAAWLGRRIARVGSVMRSVRLVRDDPPAIAAAVRAAADGADVVVVCGGIGPTEDDRTREGLALACGRPLVELDDAAEAIVSTLARRGKAPQAGFRRQAAVPEGGQWIDNPQGVAPGVLLEIEDASVFALPGVPVEMHAMFERHVEPRLTAGGARPACERSVWAAGISEPDVEQRLRDVLQDHDVRVGYYPHGGEVEVRLFSRAVDAARSVAAVEAAALERLGPHAYQPPEGGRIEHVVVEALRRTGGTITTAESVTGGLIAEMLTRVPGASSVFPGGFITYAASAKCERLGVDPALIEAHGVVSAEVAAAMAEGARRVAGTLTALATTGVAGPDPLPGPDGEPVAVGRVHVALATEDAPTQVRQLDVPMTRDSVRRRAAIAALDLLRRHLASRR